MNDNLCWLGKAVSLLSEENQTISIGAKTIGLLVYISKTNSNDAGFCSTVRDLIDNTSFSDGTVGDTMSFLNKNKLIKKRNGRYYIVYNVLT